MQPAITLKTINHCFGMGINTTIKLQLLRRWKENQLFKIASSVVNIGYEGMGEIRVRLTHYCQVFTCRLISLRKSDNRLCMKGWGKVTSLLCGSIWLLSTLIGQDNIIELNSGGGHVLLCVPSQQVNIIIWLRAIFISFGVFLVAASAFMVKSLPFPWLHLSGTDILPFCTSIFVCTLVCLINI